MRSRSRPGECHPASHDADFLPQMRLSSTSRRGHVFAGSPPSFMQLEERGLRSSTLEYDVHAFQVPAQAPHRHRRLRPDGLPKLLAARPRVARPPTNRAALREGPPGLSMRGWAAFTTPACCCPQSSQASLDLHSARSRSAAQRTGRPARGGQFHLFWRGPPAGARGSVAAELTVGSRMLIEPRARDWPEP